MKNGFLLAAGLFLAAESVHAADQAGPVGGRKRKSAVVVTPREPSKRIADRKKTKLDKLKAEMELMASLADSEAELAESIAEDNAADAIDKRWRLISTNGDLNWYSLALLQMETEDLRKLIELQALPHH